jgi:nucleotide-binding universal stress UspA family protein
MVLGSVAEEIFRRADCMVLTVGPNSFGESPLDKPGSVQTILFATDFGPASYRALKHAIPFANHFGVKLTMLHVAPIVPIPDGFHWSQTSGDVRKLQEDARGQAIAHMEKMVSASAPLNMRPEFLVKFGAPSKMIVHVARELNADLIVMGLNRTKRIATASHAPWATAYEVVCRAGCSVLTVRS